MIYHNGIKYNKVIKNGIEHYTMYKNGVLYGAPYPLGSFFKTVTNNLGTVEVDKYISAYKALNNIIKTKATDILLPYAYRFNSSTNNTTLFTLNPANGNAGSSTLSRNSSATFITDDKHINTVDANVHRFQNNSILIEGAGTNNLLHSYEIPSTSWNTEGTTGGGMTFTQQPNTLGGTQPFITRISVVSNNTVRRFYAQPINTSNSYYATLTLIVRQVGTGGPRYLYLRNSSTSGTLTQCVFDIQTASVTIATSVFTSVQTLADGFVKITMRTSVQITGIIQFLCNFHSSSTLPGTTNPTYNGPSGSIEIYACQLELQEGTSYMATSGTAVTREADNLDISLTAASDLFIHGSKSKRFVDNVNGLYTVSNDINNEEVRCIASFPTGTLTTQERNTLLS